MEKQSQMEMIVDVIVYRFQQEIKLFGMGPVYMPALYIPEQIDDKRSKTCLLYQKILIDMRFWDLLAWNETKNVHNCRFLLNQIRQKAIGTSDHPPDIRELCLLKYIGMKQNTQFRKG